MRRPTPSVLRLLPALAALAALAALGALGGCATGSEVADCPGVPVGTFQVRLSRTAAACQGDTAPADGDQACQQTEVGWILGRCQVLRPVPACCFDNLFPPALPVPVPGAPPPTLTVTVAYASIGPGASVCLPRPKASAFTGTHTAVTSTGEQLSVALETSGAVLGSCAAACAVTVHQTLTGQVARDPVSGLATGFTGEHGEVASPTPSAVCAPCVAPCSATWSLTTATAP